MSKLNQEGSIFIPSIDLLDIGINHLDLESEIEVNPNNSFRVKYKLIAVGESKISTDITVKQYGKSDSLVEIIPRVIGESYKNVDINIMYGGKSEIYTEIQPIGYMNMEAEIYVRPNNRFTALYEIQQPPLIEESFKATIDAFTRNSSNFKTINYGSNSSMVVGRLDGEEYNSYVKFDFGKITPSYKVTNAKLRLHYSGKIPELGIDIYDIAEYWQENSITSSNAPELLSLISDKYTDNTTGRYIDIDVTDKTLEWINNPYLNNGFALKLSGDSSDGQFAFRTRESNFKPELIITYYDTTIFSFGRSQVLSEINIMKADSNDKNVEIEVSSAFEFSVYNSEIRVHRVEVPFDEDYESEITVTKPYVFTQITSAIRKEDEKYAEISVFGDEKSEFDSIIDVNRPFAESEIYIRYSDIIESEITARAYDEDEVFAEITSSKPLIYVQIDVLSKSDILSEITATRPQIETEITVAKINSIDVEIVINDIRYNTILTEITSNRRFILSEVTSRVQDEYNLPSIITVTQDSIWSDIEVKERNTIDVEIDIIGASKIPTEISVTRTTINSEIIPRVFGHNEIYSEVYVSNSVDIPTEINARSTSQILTEINIMVTSNILTEVTAHRTGVTTEIYPRVIGNHDVLSTIQARVFMVDNIDTVIIVGSKRGAYAFIM